MEEVERFTAEGDGGRRYTVILWANMTEFRALDGSISRHRGGTTYQLLDGTHVNFKEAGVYEIWDTEECIRKVMD